MTERAELERRLVEASDDERRSYRNTDHPDYARTLIWKGSRHRLCECAHALADAIKQEQEDD